MTFENHFDNFRPRVSREFRSRDANRGANPFTVEQAGHTKLTSTSEDARQLRWESWEAATHQATCRAQRRSRILPERRNAWLPRTARCGPPLILRPPILSPRESGAPVATITIHSRVRKKSDRPKGCLVPRPHRAAYSPGDASPGPLEVETGQTLLTPHLAAGVLLLRRHPPHGCGHGAFAPQRVLVQHACSPSLSLVGYAPLVGRRGAEHTPLPCNHACTPRVSPGTGKSLPLAHTRSAARVLCG